MNRKKIVIYLSVLCLLLAGIGISFRMASSAPTYDGSGTDVVSLYENPSDYDNSGADGIASVIVNENNEKTVADNVVFSVVFNYRGYDTLGESFILIAAISGTMAILRRTSSSGASEKKGAES